MLEEIQSFYSTCIANLNSVITFIAHIAYVHVQTYLKLLYAIK